MEALRDRYGAGVKKIIVASLFGLSALLTLTGCSTPSSAPVGSPAVTTPSPAVNTPSEMPMEMDVPPSVMPADLIPADLDTPGSGTKWGFISAQGAVGVFRLPSEESDYCKKANAHLKKSYTVNKLDGFTPYKCVTVAVDNRQGQGTVNMYSLQLLDSEGKAYDSVGISEDKGWMYGGEGSQFTGDTTVYNEGVELSNNGNGFYLNPGAKGVKTLFFKEIPANPTRVWVMPDGAFEQAEAMPVGAL